MEFICWHMKIVDFYTAGYLLLYFFDILIILFVKVSLKKATFFLIFSKKLSLMTFSMYEWALIIPYAEVWEAFILFAVSHRKPVFSNHFKWQQRRDTLLDLNLTIETSYHWFSHSPSSVYYTIKLLLQPF